MKLCSCSGLRDNASLWLRVALFVVSPLLVNGDARSDSPQQVSADFRERFDPALFRLMGGPTPADYCRLEKSGVRCQIPAGDPTINYCGLHTQLVVGGDFAITARYEINRLPAPPSGHGAGVKISIKDVYGDGASLQRLHMRGGREGWSAHRAELQPDGGTKHSSVVVSNSSPKGRLRIARTGSTLRYLVAEGDSDEFNEIRSADFSDRDLVQLHLAAQTGDANTEVDVIWTGVEIEAQRLVRPFEAVDSRWSGRNIAVSAIGIGMLIAVLLYVFRRRSGAVDA